MDVGWWKDLTFRVGGPIIRFESTRVRLLYTRPHGIIRTFCLRLSPAVHCSLSLTELTFQSFWGAHEQEPLEAWNISSALIHRDRRGGDLRRSGYRVLHAGRVIQPPSDSVSSLSFSPKANFLVATSWDNQ
ncbi:hypothetical protein CRG98_041770, partial [Punica granatum]